MNTGTKIIGTYVGFSIKGTITESRAITNHPDCIEHHVALDAPVTVFGQDRDHVLVMTKWDGTPSNYANRQPQDWMKAI
jgi:hypothetical protein